MHLKLGFVIGCKITTFLQILQYANEWMVTRVVTQSQQTYDRLYQRHKKTWQRGNIVRLQDSSISTLLLVLG